MCRTQPVTVTVASSGFTESHQFNVTVQSPLPKREIAFRVCRDRFIFFTHVGATYVYGNEGEGWTTVVPDQDDMIRFQATERVRFAERFSHTYNFYSGGPTTRVIHATADELEEMQCPSASTGSERFTVMGSNAVSYWASFGMFRPTMNPGLDPPAGGAGPAPMTSS